MLIIEKIKSIYFYPYTVYKKIENYVILYYLMLFILYYNSLQYTSLNYNNNNNIMNPQNNLRRHSSNHRTTPYPNQSQRVHPQLNQAQHNNTERYLVRPNNGQDDGMYNQCMWISIRDFLIHNGYPLVTTRRVRAVAGLNSSTENMSFDFMKPEFASALYRVANYYNLQIVIRSINRDGTRSHSVGKFIMDPIQGEIQEIYSYIPTEGAFAVNIAQYGSSHFEWIVSGPNIKPIVNAIGMPFVPAVPMKTTVTTPAHVPAPVPVPTTTSVTSVTATATTTTITTIITTLRKVSELSPAEKKIAEMQQETISLVEIRKIVSDNIASEQQYIRDYAINSQQTQNSKDLPDDLKKQLVESFASFKESSLKIINECKQKLQHVDTQICDLQTQIFKLEK